MGGRTAASALDGRAAVWSLTRFRGGGWPWRDFFHESAYDFLLDDGTDEPVWIEVAGGMLIEQFPPEERVQFHSTTLLELEHPFLTRLRIDSRHVRASEIRILPGDAIEVVGRLSRRLDPTVRSQSGRDPPQRRVLRSGTRVPVLIKKLSASDSALARVRRIAPPDPGAVAGRAAAAPFLITAIPGLRRARTGAGFAPLAHCANGGRRVAAQGNMTKKILVSGPFSWFTPLRHGRNSPGRFPTGLALWLSSRRLTRRHRATHRLPGRSSPTTGRAQHTAHRRRTTRLATRGGGGGRRRAATRRPTTTTATRRRLRAS